MGGINRHLELRSGESKLKKNEYLNLIFEIIVGFLGISLIAIGIVVTTNVEIIINITWPLFVAGGVFILLSILTILHDLKFRNNKKKKTEADNIKENSKQQKDNSLEVPYNN